MTRLTGRFIKIEPGLVNEGRALGGPAVLTYMALAAHAYGNKRDCRPSLTRLADLTGHDRRTITRALTTLEAAGWIERRKGGGRGTSTIYTLTRRAAETGAHSPLFQDENRGNGAQKQGQRCTKTGASPPPEEDNEEYREEERRARVANADARANIARHPAPSSSSSLPDPDDPADVEAVLLSWEWTDDRLRRVLNDSGFRMQEVVREMAKRRSIWELNNIRVVVRDDGAFLELLKAVERARASLSKRCAAKVAV